MVQSISPLLKRPFRDNKFALGVIKDLHEEYKKNPTLRNKFGWVSLPEYVQNRQRCFKFSKDELVEINMLSISFGRLLAMRVLQPAK